MQLLHARVHRTRLRELIAAVPVFGDQSPEPLMIACPACGDEFFADLEALEWGALVRLEGECPDHAHRFAVGE